MLRVLKIICILSPLIGFFIAIGSWLFKKEEAADELIFFCIVGILINIFVFLPLGLLIRAFI
jgi:hypothetical protein